MEPFYIMRHIRKLSDKHGFPLSATEIMEIYRILLCPAEREYIFENDESLLQLIRRIKENQGAIQYPRSNPLCLAGQVSSTVSTVDFILYHLTQSYQLEESNYYSQKHLSAKVKH